MKSLKLFLSDDRTWIIGIGAIALTLLLLVSGCNVRSLFPVNAPREIVEVYGEEITLSNAADASGAWRNHVEMVTQKFYNSYEDQEKNYTFLKSVVDLGIDNAEGFGVSGLGLGLLLGVTGLALPQPKIMKRFHLKGEDK